MRRRRSAASGSTFAARSVSAYSCAEGISTSPCVKRWPKDLPEPASVSPSSFSQYQRTGPRKAMPARIPAHGLAELEPVDDRAHPVEQRLSAQRLSGHAGPQMAVPLLEVRLGEPVALREAGRRLLAALRRRPLDQLLGGGLRQLVDDERDSPGRHVDVRRLHAQLASDELRKLCFGLPACRGGQLLAADLKQQRRHRASPRRGGPLSA